MTTSINWDDGSGDKITLTYNLAQGDLDVTVTSDPNTGDSDRSKTVTFRTSTETAVTKTLKITQKAVVPITLTLHPSAFVSGSYSSISGQTTPIGKSETSTSYATITLKTGSRASTNAFWKFDTSSIPSNATIISVSCKAKAYISQTNSNRISTRLIQLYKGTTTAKGSATTISTSTSELTLSCGTWTAADLADCYIRLYAVRGTSLTSNSVTMRFYGATLTVVYKVQ